MISVDKSLIDQELTAPESNLIILSFSSKIMLTLYPLGILRTACSHPYFPFIKPPPELRLRIASYLSSRREVTSRGQEMRIEVVTRRAKRVMVHFEVELEGDEPLGVVIGRYNAPRAILMIGAVGFRAGIEDRCCIRPIYDGKFSVRSEIAFAVKSDILISQKSSSTSFQQDSRRSTSNVVADVNGPSRHSEKTTSHPENENQGECLYHYLHLGDFSLSSPSLHIRSAVLRHSSAISILDLPKPRSAASSTRFLLDILP